MAGFQVFTEAKNDDGSKGYGGALFDWLVEHAREHDCDQFHLDSGVQRFRAHRFICKSEWQSRRITLVSS
jgi:hypothetical protein